MKLLAGILLGWTLNIAVTEFSEFQYYDLEIDALNLGLPRKHTTGAGLQLNPIKIYIEKHRYKSLDLILYKPNLWTCRFIFEHEKCPLESLLRSPIPLDQRPKWDKKNIP